MIKRFAVAALSVSALSAPALASALGSFSGGTVPEGGGVPTQASPGGSRCFGEMVSQNRPSAGFGQEVSTKARLGLITVDVFTLQTSGRELCREP